MYILESFLTFLLVDQKLKFIAKSRFYFLCIHENERETNSG